MKHTGFKKITSVLMAAVLLAVSSPFTIPTQGATTKIDVEFAKGDKLTTGVVEGNGTGVITKLPSGYTAVENKPFLIKDSAAVEVATGMISYTPGNITAPVPQFTAHKGSAGALGTAATSTYTITGQFYALIAEGDATETWGAYKVKNPNDTVNPDALIEIDPAGSGIASIVSSTSQGITIDSYITIACTTGETETTPPSFEVTSLGTDGTTPSGTGALLGYNQVTPIANAGGTAKTVNFRLSKNGNDGIDFKLSPTQQHSVVEGWKVVSPDGVTPQKWEPIISAKRSSLIMKGTTYRIAFVMPTSNSLFLQVVTPKFLTNEISGSIAGEKTWSSYVKLAQNDDKEWITKNFNMLTKVTAYDAETKITWAWDEGRNNTIDVGGAVGIENGQSSASATIVPQEDDILGNLVATVSYKGVEETTITTSEAKIPVIIKGKGKPPYVKLGKKTTNKLEEPITTSPTDVDNIKFMPNEMDVYDGSVVPFVATEPYQFDSTIYMGAKNAASDHVIITSSNPSAVDVYLDGNLVPYKFGEKFANPNAGIESKVNIRVKAKTGATNTILTFDFYGKVNGGAIERYSTLTSPNITVGDTTPSSDATLKSIIIKSKELENKNYPLDIAFTPEKSVYALEVPFAAKTVDVSFAVNDRKSTVVALLDGIAPTGDDSFSGTIMKIGKLDVDITRVVRLEVTAENPKSKQIYILNITRAAASRDSSLKSLKIFSEASADAKDLLAIVGTPSSTKTYELHVPYGVKRVRVDAEATNPWVRGISILPNPVREMFFSKTEWIDLGHKDDKNKPSPNPTPIMVKVLAEDINDIYSTTYFVNATRDDPSENNMLKSLELLDNKGTVMPFKVGATEQKFVNNQRDYYMNINYSTEQIRLKAQPEHEYATGVTLVMPDGKTKTLDYDGRKDTPVEFRDIFIDKVEYPTTFKIKVYATAESGRPTTEAEANASTSSYYLYTIEITRNPADSDARLDTLTLADQDGKAVDAFSFNAEKLEYDITVPFVTSNVTVTPKPKSALSFATVNNLPITENRPFISLPLTAGKKEVVTVIVEAESGEKKTYTLNITRSMPSAEARLELLSVPEGTDFAPRFVPANTAYTVKLKEDTKTYTVLAKPVDEYATIEINGKAAASNVAFGPITSVEESSKVTIKVTAQDGKTTKVYTITITDENFIIKGDNPDLAALRIENGEMSPRFKPGIQDYEVYVKSETDWINVFPKPIDRNSTLEVFAGSKKLGDYYSDYSTAITDDTIDLSVKVTAPSGVSKTYNATVYRNNDEKQGKLRPITADMVNFEQASPIIVDISKYYVVSAEVINRMIEYPDKTIIFKGNDYSFEMRGKDLKELVPNTDLFDLSLKFSTSEEDRIWDIMDEESRNDDLEPVFVHFNHHGKLPAPFKLTLSLGREYQNRTLYWNYFNEERDRIDYYGTVRTNVKGTFTAMMTHMSDYIVTKRRIIGSENKESEATSYSYGMNTWMDEPKTNPNTGRAGVE